MTEKKETMKVGRLVFELSHTWSDGMQRWLPKKGGVILEKSPRGKWSSIGKNFATPLEALNDRYSRERAKILKRHARELRVIEKLNPGERK